MLYISSDKRFIQLLCVRNMPRFNLTIFMMLIVPFVIISLLTCIELENMVASK